MISKAKPTQWTPASPHTVCAQIACAALGAVSPLDVRDPGTLMQPGEIQSSSRSEDVADSGSKHQSSTMQQGATLGGITLRSHQIDAVQRIRASIRSVGGALLADAVGLGKTYVGLALARDYERVHILAPATLLPMWREAIITTGTLNVSLHSVQTLSRRPLVADRVEGSTLIIVDEAHHLRTRNTARYRNAQQFSASRDVLLMTATPVHNRTRELRNLLALFLGNRVDVLDRATLSECVIRRTAGDAESVAIPTVQEHAAIAIPDNRAVLECILQLAPPLPVNEGAAASALVRLGLLRAWCSSDAALTDRIRRRQLRGEALLHSLAHGRYPTQRELESWIVGSDSVQLGFPELLIATAPGETSVLLKTLVSHLDSLQMLLQVHTRTSSADASRSSALRALLQREPHVPVIAFSQFASTVRALYRALSDMAGVASLTSEGGRIASGPIPRHELIANFAPKANGRPPPTSARQIRLLITTDLLAEGVNLQDAGTVVHLDLPWTHALKQQRVGRIARMGSSFSLVHVHTFAPPMGAEHALQLVATLGRKAGLHRDWVGFDDRTPAHGSTTITSAPDEATQLRTLLLRWRAGAPPSTTGLTAVAAVRVQLGGWIAVAECNGEQIVVACTYSPSATNESGAEFEQVRANHAGTDASTLYHAARTANDALTEAAHFSAHSLELKPDARQVQVALDEVSTWLRTREIQTLSGNTARSTSPAQKRALDALATRLNNTSAARRSTLADRASSIERKIMACRGAGAEHNLLTWITGSNALTTTAWMDSFPDSQTERIAPMQRASSVGHHHVTALLLLQPDIRESPDESLT